MNKLVAAQQQDKLNLEAARLFRDYNQANDFTTVLPEASYFSIAQRHSCRSQGNNPNSQNMIFLERDIKGIIKTCDACQRSNNQTRESQTGYLPIVTN